MNKTGWVALVGVAALAVIVLVVSLFANFNTGRGYGWGMMWPGMMGGWGFPLMGGIGMLLFWLLIIGGVVWLAQSVAHGVGPLGAGAPPSESPLDILKRRYARGEINQDQFEQMKRDLGA